MTPIRVPSLLAAAIVAAVIATGCGKDETGQNDLWDRAYRSTAVTEDSESRPLVADTHINVRFEQREGQGVVGWQAGCNTFGADVEITADSLVIGGIVGTEIGCPHDLQQQDEWLVDFFGSDPEWQRSGDRLSLTSHNTVIELEAKPHG